MEDLALSPPTALDPRVADLLAERAPRYTSYPTAAMFGDAVGPDDYAEWLERIPGGAALSLYLHVPFCRALCWYCGCHTMVPSHDDIIASYAEALEAEIAQIAGRIGGKRPVGHIHFGGGTPHLLGPRDLDRVMSALHRRFAIGTDAEIAIEIDPRTIDARQVAVLAELGFTRASLGVQDFHGAVQAAINRIQPYEMTARVVDDLRRAGMRSINLDLMYGLPRQTEASVIETVSRALTLAPDRIALFGYAHLPDRLRHQRKIADCTLPDPAERWQQARAAATVLIEAGYRQIGLDHFARPGDPLARQAETGALHRNFQGYTTDRSETLLGFGASAIGRLAEGFVQNTPAIAGYMRAVQDGRLATSRGLRLTEEDRARGRIIEKLMCGLAADLADLGADAPRRAARAALDPLIAAGLARLDGTRLTVTEEGRPLLRLAARAFDAYVERAKAGTLAV